MATSTLEIVIQAKDEAGSKLKGLADSAKKLEPAFKQMAVVGGVAFASISAFAISSIKSSNEAELAQKQLEHAVISVSKATRAQLKETEDLANALEAKGVLDGDNIKIGLAQLSTFGLSNKAVRGLGGALSDLAVNQFGVNASGEQMSQTANMIAKALNGQFGVLEKSGIRFSESQRHMIEFGTEMEKVSAINEGFAQNLKFTNDVALKTTDGQLAKLNVQFDNLKTSIGDQLKPVLIQLLQAITPILLKITDWVAQNPELTRNIILIVGALTGLVAIVGALGIAMLALTPAMLTAMGTALAITAVLALLGLAVYNVSQIMYILKYDSALVLLGIKTYFQEFVAWINAKVVNPIKDYFRDVWVGIKAYFKEGVDAIVGYFQPLFDTINRVKTAMSNIGGSIKSTVGGLVGNYSGERALGGGVLAGNTYMVGEKGPEMFTASRSGTILPNNSLAGAGGNITVNINGGTYLSESVAQEIGDMIISQFSRNSRF